MECPNCKNELQKTKRYLEEYWGAAIEVEFTLECPYCGYAIEYAYGSWEEIRQGREIENNNFEEN